MFSSKVNRVLGRGVALNITRIGSLAPWQQLWKRWGESQGIAPRDLLHERGLDHRWNFSEALPLLSFNLLHRNSVQCWLGQEIWSLNYCLLGTSHPAEELKPQAEKARIIMG